MSIEKYKQALDSARKALAELLKARENLDRQISKMEVLIISLADVCGESPDQVPGESDATSINLRAAIRLVFRAARPNALSPTEVRDKLKEMGFQLDRYKYELPPIHNTIARLLLADEIEVENLDGTKKYKWVGHWTRAARQATKEKMRFNLYGERRIVLEEPKDEENPDIPGQGGNEK